MMQPACHEEAQNHRCCDGSKTNFNSTPIATERKFQLRNTKQQNEEKEQGLINDINRLIKIRTAKKKIKEQPLKSIYTPLGKLFAIFIDGLQVLKDLLIEANEDKENEGKFNNSLALITC